MKMKGRLTNVGAAVPRGDCYAWNIATQRTASTRKAAFEFFKLTAEDENRIGTTIDSLSESIVGFSMGRKSHGNCPKPSNRGYQIWHFQERSVSKEDDSGKSLFSECRFEAGNVRTFPCESRLMEGSLVWRRLHFKL